MAKVVVQLKLEMRYGHPDNLPGKEEVLKVVVEELPKCLQTAKDKGIVYLKNYSLASVEVLYG